MTSKSAPIPFQPAPRPQSRVSPEQTRELAEATRDLGFGRTTSTPVEAPAEAGPPKVTPPATSPIAATVAQRPARSQSAKPEQAAQTAAAAVVASDKMATLKVAMPDDIWNALRLEALNRRVTVKYLVMEALAAMGYAIDLSQVAEDGRRLR